MASSTRSASFSSRLIQASLLASFPAIAALISCSHDWDRYDPTQGSQDSSSSSASSTVGPSTSTAGPTSSSTGTTIPTTSTGSTDPVGAACGPDGLANLRDSFEGTSLADWWTPALAGGNSFQQANGNITLSVFPGANTYATLLGSARYDMSNCGVFVEVQSVPTAAGMYINLVVKQDDYMNFVEFTYEGGKLRFKYTLQQIPTTVTVTDYDPVMHRFWRIDVQDGITKWKASPDAKTWTTLAQQKVPVLTYKWMLVGFGAGAFNLDPDPTKSESMNVDNFDMVPP